MAIEISQIDNLPDYTPAHLLKMVNYAIVQINASGESYSINGRSWGRSNLQELREWRSQLQSEIDAAASSSGRNASLGDFSNQ